MGDDLKALFMYTWFLAMQCIFFISLTSILMQMKTSISLRRLFFFLTETIWRYTWLFLSYLFSTEFINYYPFLDMSQCSSWMIVNKSCVFLYHAFSVRHIVIKATVTYKEAIHLPSIELSLIALTAYKN